MAFNNTELNELPSDDLIVDNHEFFLDINVSDFRTKMRVDNVTTPARAHAALEAAVMEVNAQLSDWVKKQMDAGYYTILDVPSDFGQPTKQKEKLYVRAVYCVAKANLSERYRDYDTTGKGTSRADDLDETIIDLRRDAAFAISDLQGFGRVRVSNL